MADSSCATSTGPDTRNLRWKENNVGSTLLQKMGWKHGQALGSRKRRSQALSSQRQEGGDEDGGDTNTSNTSKQRVLIYFHTTYIHTVPLAS